jgi:hypothetical protein
VSLIYLPGEWYAAVRDDLLLVLPPGARGRAAALWSLVDEGVAADAVLDAVLAAGLSELPGLALLSVDDGRTRALVRGEVTCVLDGPQETHELDGRQVTTWQEVRSTGPVSWALRCEAADLPQPPDVPGSAGGAGSGWRVDRGLVRLAAATRAASTPDSTPATTPATTPAPPTQDGEVPPVAVLRLPHGERVPVDRTVLLGRAPELRRHSAAGAPRLVALPSPQQEVSATHLEVRPGEGADLGAAVATDLGSTNGTVLAQPGLPAETLLPGVPAALLPGALLDLGDGCTLVVEAP